MSTCIEKDLYQNQSLLKRGQRISNLTLSCTCLLIPKDMSGKKTRNSHSYCPVMAPQIKQKGSACINCCMGNIKPRILFGPFIFRHKRTCLFLALVSQTNTHPHTKSKNKKVYSPAKALS